jgi:phosphoribosylformylglycinamidine synthase
MSRYRVSVHIVPRRGLLDPQGKAVADALHTLGFGAVREVRVGRHVVVETDADSAESADGMVRDMCERLLANPVTEDFEIAGISDAGGAAAASADGAYTGRR